MFAHLCRPIRFGIDRAMKLPPAKRLLLWVHDVSPQLEAEVDRQHEVLSRFASANRIGLLVVPNHSGNAPIWAPRLRTKRGPRPSKVVPRSSYSDIRFVIMLAIRVLRPASWAKHEGQSSRLSRSKALRRMQSGQRLLENIYGQPLGGFSDPAWPYCP